MQGRASACHKCIPFIGTEAKTITPRSTGPSKGAGQNNSRNNFQLTPPDTSGVRPVSPDKHLIRRHKRKLALSGDYRRFVALEHKVRQGKKKSERGRRTERNQSLRKGNNHVAGRSPSRADTRTRWSDHDVHVSDQFPQHRRRSPRSSSAHNARAFAAGGSSSPLSKQCT